MGGAYERPPMPCGGAVPRQLCLHESLLRTSVTMSGLLWDTHGMATGSFTLKFACLFLLCQFSARRRVRTCVRTRLFDPWSSGAVLRCSATLSCFVYA